MEFSVDPVWSWPFVLLCSAMLGGILALGYPRRIRHLTRTRQRLLIATRIALVVLLLFLMLRPSIVRVSQDKSDSAIYVLNDVSRSMQTPDGISGKTRFQEQQELMFRAKKLLDQLSETLEIRYREYSDTLRIPESATETPEGETTSFSNTLDKLLEELGSGNAAAVIMTGDGRQAAAGEGNRNPIPMSRLLARKNSPIYATVFGSSDVTSAGVDAAVTELDVPQDVFVRNIVPVKFHVKAVGASGRKIRVRLLLENPSQQKGESGEMLPIPADQQNRSVYEFIADSDNVDKVVELQFVPPRVGEWKVGVEVEPLEGEVRPTNNRSETIIRVRKGGIRVVYFDRMREELRWIRSITISSRVQLDFVPLYAGRFKDRNQFDESWFTPGNVDAFIIGDVPAEAFGEERLNRIVQCCKFGAGLLMTGGVNNFGNGGYQDHPVSRLFPIDMAATTKQLTGDVQMVPTEWGLRQSVMQIAPPEVNQQRWDDLPPLNGATRLELPKGTSLAQVLAETPSGTPLLLAQDSGSSRVMAFAGDTTWHWYLHQRPWGRDAFQRFWRQVIFWVTNKDQDTDNPVWINATPRDVVPGQAVEATFGTRDDQGRAVADAKYEVTLSRPDGTKESLVTSRDGSQGTARVTDTSQPGDYWLRVTSEHNGIHHQAMTRFLVNARDPELDNPSADPEMMRELAYHSGGDFVTSDELLERLERWARDGVPGLQIDRAKRVNLWDNWYLLLLFAGLMTFEWTLRKKSGLV